MQEAVETGHRGATEPDTSGTQPQEVMFKVRMAGCPGMNPFREGKREAFQHERAPIERIKTGQRQALMTS